jgi:hypothetical protein
MAFNVKEFVSKLGISNGISRRTHFEFQIVLPEFLQTKYNANHFTMMAVSANIPSINMDTTQIRRSTVSYKEAFPINISFGDLSVTFYSDGQGKTLTALKEWLNYMFPVDFTINDSAFRVPYKSEYATKATVIHFDPEGNAIVKYTFDEVYPAGVQDIALNWGAFEDVVTVQADFKYSTYKIENLIQESKGPDPVVPSPASNNRLPQIPIIVNK